MCFSDSCMYICVKSKHLLFGILILQGLKNVLFFSEFNLIIIESVLVKGRFKILQTETIKVDASGPINFGKGHLVNDQSHTN